MTVTLWRIATEAVGYGSADSSGTGARRKGGRWNRVGTAMVYAAPSQALAALETIVHLGAGSLPLNRYLVSIDVPDEVWDRKRVLDEHSAPGGWDAIPVGQASLQYGSQWIASHETALLLVPSIVVPMEQNVLINPAHADAGSLVYTTVRRFLYDSRLRDP